MKRVAEIGMKIDGRQREYYRYTGASAEAEAAGKGASHTERFPELVIRPEAPKQAEVAEKDR
jgi:hypothetical protein